MMRTHNEFSTVESKKFALAKLKNLKFIWRFRPSCPWFVPETEIRNYYGEKVALYFTFLGYYTKELMLMGIAGLAVFIVQ